MTSLYLVKHSLPSIDPDEPSALWVLSEEGQGRCVWLADALAEHGVSRLYCSLEPKAAETAALAGSLMPAEVVLHPGLHENDRTGFAFQEREDLRAEIRAFFDRPDEVVIGQESARMALERFSSALRLAQRDARDKTIAIVAHGTVITLFVAAHNPAITAFQLWDHLGTPSYITVDADTYKFDGKIHTFAD